MRTGPLLALLASAFLEQACSRGSEATASGSPGRSSAASSRELAPLAVRTPRSSDPRVADLRAHIEHGRAEEAAALLSSLESADPGADLLRARLAALTGRNVEAIRLIGTARKERPADPEVYATGAEVYAAAGKLDAAADEVRAGLAACGEGPELSRARGVLAISRQGGAKKGLALLEEARRADPDLPFVERALSQAHLLVGKELAAAGKIADALLHACEAAALDPEDVDARRFLGDSFASAGDLESAAAVIEALVARGEPLHSELALTRKKAGIAALLARDRERALAHFAAARKLGLSDAELSSGARVLAEEAADRIEKGVAAYASDDLETAEARFREALELDPEGSGAIRARNHLAVVLFKRNDHRGAVELWRAVLATARAEGLALPEPVHVNLAKAQAQAGDEEEALATLREYLAREPDGEWADETRAAISALSPEKRQD